MIAGMVLPLCRRTARVSLPRAPTRKPRTVSPGLLRPYSIAAAGAAQGLLETLTWTGSGNVIMRWRVDPDEPAV